MAMIAAANGKPANDALRMIHAMREQLTLAEKLVGESRHVTTRTVTQRHFSIKESGAKFESSKRTGSPMSATPELLQLESRLRLQQMDKFAAAQFVSVCRSLARHKQVETAAHELSRILGRDADAFQKAAVSGMGLADVWATPSVQGLAFAYLESIRPSSLIDTLGLYAQPIPAEVSRVLIASGAVANVVAEGSPKAVTRVNLSGVDATPVKCAAIIVLSDELNLSASLQARALFERELRSAILTACNAALLAQFTKTSIAGTGSALGDLKAGIDAAGDSVAYIVAAQKFAVRELAFESQGRMGPNGGEFLPGIHVVPVDPEDTSAPNLTVIPASQVALADFGLTVRNASHAAVEMSDLPSSPAQLVSLWQANLHAVLVERSFRLLTEANAIEVG